MFKKLLWAFTYRYNHTAAQKTHCESVFTAKRNQIRAYTMNMDMDSGNSWRGMPLSEIYGSQSPWGAPEFPLVSPSFHHAVLYHIPNSGCVANDRPPKPQIGQDKWDSEHVRMPCSDQSLYPVEDVSSSFVIVIMKTTVFSCAFLLYVLGDMIDRE